MFKGLSKLVKKAAPIALPFVLPGVGAAIAPGLSPFMQSALTSGIGAALMGAKPKDAILSGIMGGAASSAFAPAAGAQAGTSGITQAGAKNLSAFGGATSTLPGTEQIIAEKVATSAPVFTGKPETFSATLLEGLGLAGKEDPNLLFKLLNTRMGEGLASGLAAQALASLTDEEKEEIQRRRAFGEGYGGGQLGGINYADGGEAYFPRRNGGIDPSEGSGKKDDVPAMLMAGEFVMTRDAVKGMGDGNLRKGIGRMYKMMDNLERQA
jgi:hypothetical protein